jgi:predicted RNA-binding protein
LWGFPLAAAIITYPNITYENSLRSAYYMGFNLFLVGGREMCEFNVILNGRIHFKDVVYAKNEGDNVVVRNVLGETMNFKNCVIIEIDVNATKLVLKSVKP